MFESHAQSEDTFVLPALEQFEPSVTTLFAEEHIQDHALGVEITALLAKAKRQLNAEELIELGGSINQNFAAFLVFNLKHMAKEEIMLNELLWRYYSDEEIQAITSKIIAHIEPRLLAIANRWMLRSLSNNEILFWLQQVKAKMPEQVFEGIIQTAYIELSESRFKYITHYLAEAKVA